MENIIKSEKLDSLSDNAWIISIYSQELIEEEVVETLIKTKKIFTSTSNNTEQDSIDIYNDSLISIEV